MGLEALHRQRITRNFKRLKTVAAAVTLITAVGVFTTMSQAADRSEMGDRAMPVKQTPMMGAPPPPHEAKQGNMVEPAKMGEMEVVPVKQTPEVKGRMVVPPKKDPDKPVKPCKKPPKKNTTQQPVQQHLTMGKVRAPER